jgi:hypothetical protein
MRRCPPPRLATGGGSSSRAVRAAR